MEVSLRSHPCTNLRTVITYIQQTKRDKSGSASSLTTSPFALFLSYVVSHLLSLLLDGSSFLFNRVFHAQCSSVYEHVLSISVNCGIPKVDFRWYEGPDIPEFSHAKDGT